MPTAGRESRKGIVLAGGRSTRLFPLTLALSKQLMPVYDKPMVYYPLSTLMLAQIRDILIISTPSDQPLFQRLFGDGSPLGLRISYAAQAKPEGIAQALLIGAEFFGDAPVSLILGDNLLYGHALGGKLLSASARRDGATIFGCHVAEPWHYGVVELDAQGRPRSIEEKPSKPKSNWAVPGLYFYDSHAVEYARGLKPSARGELEITDLNLRYLKENALHVELLGRGTTWLDMGTHESLLDAANFVETVQRRQGLRIACLEEIAFEQGWIDRARLEELAAAHGASSYGDYLRQMLDTKTRQ